MMLYYQQEPPKLVWISFQSDAIIETHETDLSFQWWASDLIQLIKYIP